MIYADVVWTAYDAMKAKKFYGRPPYFEPYILYFTAIFCYGYKGASVPTSRLEC